MERIAGHYDKIILTIIMCLVILFMATFTPFAESTKAVGIIAPALIAILVAGLAAVGITFVTTGAYDNINDYVESLLEEYAIDNNTTVTELFKGCQTGSNKLGQLLINNKFVLLIDTFAQWLIAKFSLAKNSFEIVQQGGAYLGDLICYPLPIVSRKGSSGQVKLVENIVTGAAQVYCLLLYERTNGGSYSGFVVISDRNTYANYEWKRYSNSAGTALVNEGSNTFYLTKEDYHGAFDVLNANTYYAVIMGQDYQNIFNSSNWSINISNPVFYTRSQIAEALSTTTDDILVQEQVGISTGDVLLPTDDTNYTDGDGAVIDLDVPWGLGYDDITDDVIPDEFSDSKEGEASIEYATEDEITEQVEDTQETTNLPTGTIPFTPLQLPQFHLVDIWHYVAQWIEDTAIAAGTLMAIVVQEPHPMVNLFYATVCLAIIFGLIKGLAK